MFELLFSNIGKKIKGLAIGTFVVEAIAAIITGIILIATDDDYLLYGLISIFWGPIAALFFSWLLYGFGELIDKTCDIDRNTSIIERNTNINNSENSNKQLKKNTEHKANNESAASRSSADQGITKSEGLKQNNMSKSGEDNTAANNPFSSALHYALQYSTDSGMRSYLNRVYNNFTGDEQQQQQQLNQILSVPDHQLRETIMSILENDKLEESLDMDNPRITLLVSLREKGLITEKEFKDAIQK